MAGILDKLLNVDGRRLKEVEKKMMKEEISEEETKTGACTGREIRADEQ